MLVMSHATYIGPKCGWNITPGETALIKPSEKPGIVLAQFDNLALVRDSESVAFGWHKFPADQFKVNSAAESTSGLRRALSALAKGKQTDGDTGMARAFNTAKKKVK